MPAKAFRSSKSSPAKSRERVIPGTTFPPSGLQVLTVPFAAVDPGHRVFHNLPVLIMMIVVGFQALPTISYRGIVGNDSLKVFRRHTVPQSPWHGNVCVNANITDRDNAKYIARMADRFVFRFGADECSGIARHMAGRNESPATSVTTGQTE